MKKIAMIIPSLLLTSCLFSCEKGKDPFVIESEEKFNEAVSFTAKDIKYIQTSRLYSYVGGFAIMRYDESYISPTVYNFYEKRVEGDVIYSSDEYFTEKTLEEGKDVYYKYKKNSTTKKWEKTQVDDQYFMTPTELGTSIKYVLGSGSVTYNTIKDKYDKYRQAYYFDTVDAKGHPYSSILSFYNNRLNYFSYEYYNEVQQSIEWGATSFTYGLITPKLPEVDDPTL